MANAPAAAVKGCETGIIVTAEAGFCEVWNGEDCLGYVKGPGKESFKMRPGQHEIAVYCQGRIVWHDTVTVGAEPEPEQPEPQETALSLDRLKALKALLVPMLEEVEKAIGELRGGVTHE